MSSREVELLLGVDALLGSPDYLCGEFLGAEEPYLGGFGFFKKIGKAIGSGVGAVAKTVGKVPVIGGGLKGAFNLTVGAPFSVASKVMSGQRLDKVVLSHLKDQVAAVKDVGPLAQTIVGFVPGVGTGISAAIGTGLALANGKPITAALLEAAKGAIPGGPAARSAFELGSAAIQGKPIDKALIAALPIPDAAKSAVQQGLSTAKAVAHGEKLDAALINNAVSLLPPEAQKALTTGMALAHGQAFQSIKAAGMMPAVTRFAGGTALALGTGSAKTGEDLVRRVVAGANSGNPQKQAAAQSVLKTTVAMAKLGTPQQRLAAHNGLKAVAELAAKTPVKKANGRPVAKGWHVSLSGRVSPT